MDSPGTEVPLVSDDGRQVPAELKLLHDHYEEWYQEMSGTWSNLVKKKVTEIWELNPSLKIRQCIVFGLGSLDMAMQEQHTAKDEQSAHSTTSSPTIIKQFIVVRMTMDYIKAAAHPIKTYFQDPKFTELDKAYLGHHGYEVLEGDSGFDMVDSTTLVFNMRSMFGWWWWPAILKAPPPVYAGLSFEVIIGALIRRQERNLRSHTHTNESDEFDSTRMEDYMNMTNTYSFPTSEPSEDQGGTESRQQSLLPHQWTFADFYIRVLKTVHKDHQPS